MPSSHLGAAMTARTHGELVPVTLRNDVRGKLGRLVGRGHVSKIRHLTDVSA